MATLVERIQALATRIATECKAIRLIAEGRARKYETTVGNGSATSITVTHNLNTRAVIVGLAANASPYDKRIPDIEHTTENTITLKFATAPATNAWRVTVIG